MVSKLAINGYGRIGQSVLRALYEAPGRSDLKVVAINSLTDVETLAYMTRYDTTYGRFPAEVGYEGDALIINGDRIKVFSAAEPEWLDWQDLGIDLMLECSGTFGDRKTAERYLASGVKKILFSHPGEPTVDKTIIFGVNDRSLTAQDRIISAGSCTTNCVVPVLKVLDDQWGIEGGLTTTIHSAMNDQPLIDSSTGPNKRLNRSGLQSIIPIETSLAKGIARLMPHLAGKLESSHLRVPTMCVSGLDLSINLNKPATAEELNQAFREASAGRFSKVMGYTEELQVSIDFSHTSESSIIDGTQTKVINKKMVRLFCWFDNEWGFANRMLDVAEAIEAKGQVSLAGE